MYFITREEDLIGKKIAFTHMAQFANAITIVTEDKGVMVVYQDGDYDDGGIFIYSEPKARKYILDEGWIRKQLKELNVITEEDLANYDKEKRIIFEKEQQERLTRQEESEKALYERLKNKFQ